MRRGVLGVFWSASCTAGFSFVGPVISHKLSQYFKQHPAPEEIQTVSWGYVSEVRERLWRSWMRKEPQESGVEVTLQLPSEESQWWILPQCCHLPQLYICGCAAWLLSFLLQLQAAELLLPGNSLQPRAQEDFGPWWEQCPCPSSLSTADMAPGSRGVLLPGCRGWKEKWQVAKLDKMSWKQGLAARKEKLKQSGRMQSLAAQNAVKTSAWNDFLPHKYLKLLPRRADMRYLMLFPDERGTLFLVE